MAFDGFFCVAVANELNALTGAKVEKIYQSAPTCMYFTLYQNARRFELILSVSASRPVLAVNENEPVRPRDPTGLCMLFRKHLQSARLCSVESVINERIIRFDFDSFDEMGYTRRRMIYAEMMGKYSNIILTDENNRILGAALTSDITSSGRRIMAGLAYELPQKQDKQNALEIDKERFFELLNENPQKKFSDLLISSFFCFSPLVAREIAYLASGDTEVLCSKADKTAFYNAFCRVTSLVAEKNFTPVEILNSEGIPFEYSFLPITQYGVMGTATPQKSFSSLLMSHFGKREEVMNIGLRAQKVQKTVTTALTRLTRKMQKQSFELEDCKKKELFKKKGDLLTANIYADFSGKSSVLLCDYDETEIAITLDPRLSVAANAQNYYKKYQKLKRAEKVLCEQIAKDKTEIEYLYSVQECIARATDFAGLDDISAELASTGYLCEKNQEQNKKKKRKSASSPLEFVTTDGLCVKVGRNNIQNDMLTASGAKNDLWFHIKGYHGAHVLLFTDGTEPSDRDYTEAASVAAYYSEKRGGGNLGVDYTRVKNLKKPNGSPPGFVTYETYNTAYVNGDLPDIKQIK